MKRKAVEYLLMVLLLSPLVLINIRSSHDWGDDFAGYINEAQNIAAGQPFYESKMIPQAYAPSYAPQYYSYGFPLLLAPVIRALGVNFRALNFYMSAWLLSWAMLVFYYLRGRFSFFKSATFVVIFFINPYFFHFKTEIISDIPFSFFFTLSLLFFIRRRELSLFYKLIFGFVMAFTIGIRDLGLFLPALIVFDIFMNTSRYVMRRISRGELVDIVTQSVVMLASCVVGIFLFSGILYKSPGGQLSHFMALYRSPNYWDTFFFNLDVYTRLFESLFRHDVGRYTFALYYSSAFMLVLFVLGFIHLFFARDRWELYLLIAYSVLVLLFPFSSQGFRYMLPVLPIIILCTTYGTKTIELPMSFTRYAAGITFLLFMSLINVKEIWAARMNQNTAVSPGPMTDESRAVFEYVKFHIPDDAIIGSVKPRALMLFTGHKTALIPKEATRDFLNDQRFHYPDYLIHIDGVNSNAVNDIALAHRDTLIWESNGNKIYKSRNGQ